MTSCVFALVMAVALPMQPDTKAEEEFREKVNTARDKAVKYLKENQGKDGSWDGIVLGIIAEFKGGPTALVALALLEAGLPANDPAITKAVDFLLKIEPSKTYVVSLQTQVLARVDKKKYAKEIQANADWLVKNSITQDGKLQGWSYPGNMIADKSNTHFAIMGLHAAAQAGAKVDDEIWKKIVDMLTRTQNKEGWWFYYNEHNQRPSHSMTVASLLGLAIAAKYGKNAKEPGEAFEKGIAALLGDKLGKFGEGKSMFVAWMTTAELGRALDTTEFRSGKLLMAWYREGAVVLLKAQQEDGSFKVQKPNFDANPLIATACALYFFGSGEPKK